MECSWKDWKKHFPLTTPGDRQASWRKQIGRFTRRRQMLTSGFLKWSEENLENLWRRMKGDAFLKGESNNNRTFLVKPIEMYLQWYLKLLWDKLYQRSLLLSNSFWLAYLCLKVVILVLHFTCQKCSIFLQTRYIPTYMHLTVHKF